MQAEPTGLSSYYLRIVPTLWLCTQRRNYRVFQHLSIPDIVDVRHMLELIVEIARFEAPDAALMTTLAPALRAFVERLLDPDPSRRGSAQEACDRLRGMEGAAR